MGGRRVAGGDIPKTSDGIIRRVSFFSFERRASSPKPSRRTKVGASDSTPSRTSRHTTNQKECACQRHERRTRSICAQWVSRQLGLGKQSRPDPSDCPGPNTTVSIFFTRRLRLKRADLLAAVTSRVRTTGSVLLGMVFAARILWCCIWRIFSGWSTRSVLHCSLSKFRVFCRARSYCPALSYTCHDHVEASRTYHAHYHDPEQHGASVLSSLLHADPL